MVTPAVLCVAHSSICWGPHKAFYHKAFYLKAFYLKAFYLVDNPMICHAGQQISCASDHALCDVSPLTMYRWK